MSQRLSFAFSIFWSDLAHPFQQPADRLWFHQERSGPVMEQLRGWMEAQLAEHKTEPNSGLGKAIQYMLRR